MDLLTLLPFIIFTIIGVGSYGFYKHAVKHTDGTDDIQTADEAQKGLMSSAHATNLAANVAKLATIETNAKDDQTGAEIKALLEALSGADRLVAAAIQRLDNLNVTPSAAQWGALGALVEWTAWVPTLTGDADLSGYNGARYYRVGDICYFLFTALNKNVTTAGAMIQITLPFTTANNGIYIPCANQLHDGTNWLVTNANIQPNTNYIRCYKTITAGGWAGTETGVYIYVSGFFEIA